MRHTGSRQHSRYHYRRRNREKHGHSSNYRDKRSRSNSRTSLSRIRPCENKDKSPELDPDIDGVPMDSLPSCEPWKKHKETTEPEAIFDSLSVGDQEFPNHCWVGEYLDEGEEKDIVPLSHDAFAKEILERQYWSADSTNLTGSFADSSINRANTDQTNTEYQSSEIGLDKPWYNSKPTDLLFDSYNTRDMDIEAASGYSSLKNFDALYNSNNFDRPVEDISEVEERRELIHERKLIPTRLAEVFDYGHGGITKRVAKLTRDQEKVFNKKSYEDSSSRSDMSIVKGHKPTRMKIDRYRTKYMNEPESLIQSYSSYDNNEDRCQSTVANTTVCAGARYDHVSDMIEYSEPSEHDHHSRYSASSLEGSGGESLTDIGITNVENAKSTEQGFPISVLTSNYSQRRDFRNLEEIPKVEPVPSPKSPCGNTRVSSSSTSARLKVKPVFKKIRMIQKEVGISGERRGDDNALSGGIGSSAFLTGPFKGSFNDTRKVLLNEDKELFFRIEDGHEALSHGRIVVKYQPNEDMVKSESPSFPLKEVPTSQVRQTQEFPHSNKPDSNLNSASVFPFFQDSEDVNRRSDDSDESHHSRSFQRRPLKHSTTSNEPEIYFPAHHCAKYVMDNTGAKKASSITQPRDLKRRLCRRNFKQSTSDKKVTIENQSLQRRDEECRQSKNDHIGERRSLSQRLFDASHERKSEDIRKFEARSNMGMNIPEPYAENSPQSRESQSHSLFHNLENSRKKGIAHICAGKEIDETPIKISFTHDGSRSFDEHCPIRKSDQNTFSEVDYGSTRIVKKENISLKSDNDDFLNLDVNVQLTRAPTKRMHNTDFTRIGDLDKFYDVSGSDKRHIGTTKLYAEEFVSVPWLQEYESWFKELMHPILSHDKYAREAGLLDHMNFLESVSKGNRRSLSYIPRGDPAKQILKFITFNKDVDVSTQSKTADSNDHNRFTGDREVLLSNPNLEVNRSNSFSLPSYLPLSPQREHALDRLSYSALSSSISARNAMKKEGSESFYVDKMASKDTSSAAKKLILSKADAMQHDDESHRHKESRCQMRTYASSSKALPKPIELNDRRKPEPKYSTQTLKKHKKAKSWEDAILSPESHDEPRGSQIKSKPEPKYSTQTLERHKKAKSSEDAILSPESHDEPRSSQIKSIESNNSCENSDVTEAKKTALSSAGSLEKKKDNPNISLSASTKLNFKNEKRGNLSKDKDLTKTSLSKKVNRPSLLQAKKDKNAVKDERSISCNFSTKEDRRSNNENTPSVPDMKRGTKRDGGISEKHSSMEHHYERQYSCPSSEVSENVANKSATKYCESTTKVAESNEEERVAKRTGGIIQSSEKKKLTDSKDGKKVTDNQQALPRKTVKKTQILGFDLLDQAKVSHRVINFKGEKYTCMTAPASKPTFTSEQKRLLPMFKKQVEKSIIQKGINVLYEFEKYRIVRIYDVGNDILKQFHKSGKNSEFTAEDTIYYVWCLFKDPTKNVLDELTRKLRKVNLDKPCFLEDLETFMLFQRTVFNLCYDYLNPKVCYSAQISDDIRYVRLRSENFFPQFQGESHIIMKLWSWYERMCSLFDNICATKKAAKWKEFPDYRKSSKSLEEKVATWLKEILQGRLYEIPEALSINIVGEVDRQLVKKDSHATKEMVVMLVVKVWLQNYFREETKSVQNQKKNNDRLDSNDMLENLVILEEVYSDESDFDEDKVEMDVDVNNEVSSLASVQVIDLF